MATYSHALRRPYSVSSVLNTKLSHQPYLVPTQRSNVECVFTVSRVVPDEQVEGAELIPQMSAPQMYLHSIHFFIVQFLLNQGRHQEWTVTSLSTWIHVQLLGYITLSGFFVLSTSSDICYEVRHLSCPDTPSALQAIHKHTDRHICGNVTCSYEVRVV
uniref:Uncharacterized protein n=1 Tax=Molossus molossus TaxID=27622 RepID=A0A7J8BMX4_MOLMO|nr:hypothetical protein HJG59_010128 [Molossus molossus]